MDVVVEGALLRHSRGLAVSSTHTSAPISSPEFCPYRNRQYRVPPILTSSGPLYSDCTFILTLIAPDRTHALTATRIQINISENAFSFDLDR